MENKLESYFSNLSNSKVGHAFLIGNTTLEEIDKVLEKIVSNYFFMSPVNLYNDPDIIIVDKTESKEISKQQIKNLQEKLNITSQIHNCKLYIINNCETLNEFAANSLLKMLEEPEENIYAILITKNVDNVYKTVKSRCHNLFISSNYNQRIDDEYFNVIEYIEKNKNKVLVYPPAELKNINKEIVKKLLIEMLMIYTKSLDALVYQNNIDNKIDFILKNNNIDVLSKKILIINEFLNKIDYNLNIKLLFDNFIIKFGRC